MDFGQGTLDKKFICSKNNRLLLLAKVNGMDIQKFLIHKFSRDIVLMGAMFRAGLLNAASVREVADNLLSTDYGPFPGYTDETLISIVVSYKDEKIGDDFNQFLDDNDVKIDHPKQTLVAKVFYYILENKLDFWAGMDFLFRVVHDYHTDEDFDGILYDYKYNVREYRDDPWILSDCQGEVVSLLNDMRKYTQQYIGHVPNDTDTEMILKKIMTVVSHKMSKNADTTTQKNKNKIWTGLKKIFTLSYNLFSDKKHII
ncbi:MAG: hypothetical protein LBF37_02355 [Rickettsiales bacterium]|jgi:hypothetical protein|nr:hypothetical protein [Rickettsiales bacterium]